MKNMKNNIKFLRILKPANVDSYEDLPKTITGTMLEHEKENIKKRLQKILKIKN